MRETPIKQAVRLLGGPTKAAETLGVHRQAIYAMYRNGVSPYRAIQIEEILGGKVSRYKLCPKLRAQQ